MRYLLDTHVLLWTLAEPKRLPRPVRQLIEDGDNEVFFSAVNIWEIAIKSALARPGFMADPDQILATVEAAGLVELPVRSVHASEVKRLPPIHGDPFDRLLIAQARVEPMNLVTADAVVAQYPGPVTYVA